MEVQAKVQAMFSPAGELGVLGVLVGKLVVLLRLARMEGSQAIAQIRPAMCL
jgi:hypothetical protein